MTVAAWVLGLAMLWYLFDGFLQRRDDPNGAVQVRDGGPSESLVLQRNRAGHYLVPGTINGHAVHFLLDTGATMISIPADLGPVLGLQGGQRYRVSTANGDVAVRSTEIAELRFGPFTLHNISADLNPGMAGDGVLLGMNALKHFEFTQRGDQLTLKLAR